MVSGSDRGRLAQRLATISSAADDAPIALDAVLRRRRKRGTWTLGIVALAISCALVLAVVTNHNLDWPVVGHYFLSAQVLKGLSVTIELSVLGTLIGVTLGAAIALMRMSGNPVLRTISLGYVWFFRSIPLLVQLLIWFNLALLFPRLGIGGASVSTNTVMTPFVAAMLGLGLNQAAYASEIVRAGLQAVPPGQTDASRVLGLSPATTMRHVILPQAARIAIPPLGNEFIGMLKNSSLVSVIAGSDLLTTVENIYGTNYEIIPLLVVACIWYAVVTGISTVGQSVLERRLANRPSSRPGATPGGDPMILDNAR
jgi:polar amino acid transport system permease protein